MKTAVIIPALLLIALSAGCCARTESAGKKDLPAENGVYLSASYLTDNGEKNAPENGGALHSPEEGKGGNASAEKDMSKLVPSEKEIALKDPAEGKTYELSEITVIRTNWSENAVITEKAANRDRLGIRSPRHLPVYKAASLFELSELTADLSYYLPAFSELAKGYDAKFFEEHILAVAYLTAGSGSYRYGVRGVEREDGRVTVIAEQTNDPEIGTCDMAGWLIAVPLPASDKDAALDARFAGKDDFSGLSLPGERIKDLGKPAGEIPFGSFSFEKVKSSVPEGWSSENFRTEGFVNTEQAGAFDPVKRGRAELTLPYEPDLTQILYDKEADIWAVRYFGSNRPGETVYMNAKGVTLLIVFDE